MATVAAPERMEDVVPTQPLTADAAVPRAGRGVEAQILVTLVGGTLLACSLVAGWLWKQPFFAALPAAAAVALLAAPLVAAAARDLWSG